MKFKYIVKWGEGFTQKTTTLSEAITIMKGLLNNYESVLITKIK